MVWAAGPSGKGLRPGPMCRPARSRRCQRGAWRRTSRWGRRSSRHLARTGGPRGRLDLRAPPARGDRALRRRPAGARDLPRPGSIVPGCSRSRSRGATGSPTTRGRRSPPSGPPRWPMASGPEAGPKPRPGGESRGPAGATWGGLGREGRMRPRRKPPVAEPPIDRRRPAWADLLRSVFAIDVLECPRYGARTRLLAAIHPPAATRAILGCLGLPARAPPSRPRDHPHQQIDPTPNLRGAHGHILLSIREVHTSAYRDGGTPVADRLPFRRSPSGWNGCVADTSPCRRVSSCGATTGRSTRVRTARRCATGGASITRSLPRAGKRAENLSFELDQAARGGRDQGGISRSDRISSQGQRGSRQLPYGPRDPARSDRPGCGHLQPIQLLAAHRHGPQVRHADLPGRHGAWNRKSPTGRNRASGRFREVREPWLPHAGASSERGTRTSKRSSRWGLRRTPASSVRSRRFPSRSSTQT